MLSLLNLVYILPIVIALIVAGVLVTPRVPAPARTLMWTGIALECLARLAAMVTPYLLINRSFAQLYPAINLTIAVLGGVGVVLLVVAIGAAARGPRPASDLLGTTAQQGWPGSPNQGPPQGFNSYPDQPGTQPGWTHGPAGQSPHDGYGRPGGQGNANEPGRWNSGPQGGNHP